MYEKLEENGLVKKTIENVYATGRRLDWKTPVPPQLTAKFDFIDTKELITGTTQQQQQQQQSSTTTSSSQSPPTTAITQPTPTTPPPPNESKKGNGSKNKKGRK